MRRFVIWLVVVSVCIGGAACSSSPTSKGAAPPAGLPPFYAVPSGVAEKAPGTLLKSEPASAPEVHGRALRVMYVSTDAHGRSVPVTGAVFVPFSPPPAGGYPVVSWAHGTNGMAARCAPSLSAQTVLPATAINAVLALGWVLVATDYQGEGTPPGLLPFLVGDVAARNAIDIVAAARDVPSTNSSNRYVVWGHSEGGHSALFAWALAKTYGSRSGLRMLGAVAGAPPSQLQTLYQFLSSTPSRVYDYMMLAGFNAAYGSTAAPLDTVLTSKGIALLPTLREECLASVAAAANAYPLARLVKSNPFGVQSWRKVLTQNDPAAFTSANDVPLLIVHGDADEVVPAATSAELADHLCRLGANVERWVYPAQSHGGALIVSALDVGHWISERFAGPASSAPYQPTGQPGVQAHVCSAGSMR